MLRVRPTMSASGFKFNFRNILVYEWIIFFLFAGFLGLSAELSMPDVLPKHLQGDRTTVDLPALNFPEPNDPNFRILNDLESAHKPVHSPPVFNPLNEILRARGTEEQLKNHLDMLSRLANLTKLSDSGRQNYTLDDTVARLVSSLPQPNSVPSVVKAEVGVGMKVGATAAAGERESESSPPELSAKIKANLAKEEDQLIVEPTKSAAGFVIVVVVVSVMSYVALFVWRKLLEQRYGNRELLLDDDQFCHASNLYDFQLGSEQEMT